MKHLTSYNSDPIESELSSSNNWKKCQYFSSKGFMYKYSDEFTFYVLNKDDITKPKSNYCLYLVNNIFDDFNFIESLSSPYFFENELKNNSYCDFILKVCKKAMVYYDKKKELPKEEDVRTSLLDFVDNGFEISSIDYGYCSKRQTYKEDINNVYFFDHMGSLYTFEDFYCEILLYGNTEDDNIIRNCVNEMKSKITFDYDGKLEFIWRKMWDNYIRIFVKKVN